MAWRVNQLRRIANAMKAGVGQTRIYRGNDAGYWLDIAHVSEQIAHATTVAGTNISGSMARTVAALESLSGTNGTGGLGDRGKLKRIVAALEALNSATYTGTLETRFELAINAFTWPAILGTLTLNPATLPEDQAGSIAIVGATSGSTLTSTALPTGLTLNSGARTISGTPTTPAVTAVTLTETKTGALNTPKDSAVTITIT